METLFYKLHYVTVAKKKSSQPGISNNVLNLPILRHSNSCMLSHYYIQTKMQEVQTGSVFVLCAVVKLESCTAPVYEVHTFLVKFSKLL